MSRLQDPANVASNNEYIVIVEATSGVGDRALTANTDAYSDGE